MQSVIETALRFRFIVLALSIGLLVTGGERLRRTPIDPLPEFSALVVEIQTEALGLPASEVEAMITVPLEEFLAGVPWLREVRSQSSNSLSSIELEFEPGTDPMQARQMVQERLIHTAALPNVSRPPAMLQPVASINRVMNVALSSESQSLIDLSVLAQWKIKPRLMGVPGVANVSIWGHRARQLQVQVDPQRLSEHGVTLSDVVAATGNGLWVTPLSFLNASTPGNGGFIDTPNQRFDIRHVLPISSAEDLARIAFGNAEGRTVTLGEVATVVEGHPPLIGDAVTGSGARTVLVVEKFPWANVTDVTSGLDDALSALRLGLPGIELHTDNYRAADLAEEARGEVAYVLSLGWVLAALALCVFLPWRAAIIGGAVSAVSIAAAALVLTSITRELDLVLVAGLVAAIAVFVGDLTRSLDRLMPAAGTRHPEWVGPTKRLSRIGTNEGAASLYGFTATIFVCVAVLLLDLGADAFVAPLLKAYVLALAAALAVAIVLVPTLASLLTPAATRPASASRLSRLTNAMTLKASARAMIAAPVALAVVALLSISLADTRLVPDLEERDLLWHLQMPPSASVPQVSGLAEELLEELSGVDGVESVVAEIGRATMSDSRAGVNAADLWIRLAADVDRDDTLQAFDAIAGRYPGLESRPTTLTAERLSEAFDSDPNTLIARIYGPDLDALRRQAESLAGSIRGIDGVAFADTEKQPERMQIEVEVDLDKAKRYGLTPGDIRRAASIVLAGLEVGNLFEDQKVFEVTVWGEPQLRRDATSVAATPIRTPDGRIVPLSALADVRETTAPSARLRVGGSRRADIVVQVDGRSAASVAEEIRALVATLDFPLEYHVEVFEDGSRRTGPIATFLILGCAALGVLLVVQAALGNWRLGAAALAVPAVGVSTIVVASNLTGGLSLGAIAGVVGVTYLSTRLAVTAAVRGNTQERVGRTSENLAVLFVVTAFLAPALVIGSVGVFHMIAETAALLLCGMFAAVAFTLVGTHVPRSSERHPDGDPLERAHALAPPPAKRRRAVSQALVLVTAVTFLFSPENGAAIEEPAHVPPATPVTGSAPKDDASAYVVLTREQTRRLGVETVPVTQARMHTPRRLYGSVEKVTPDGGLIVRTVSRESEEWLLEGRVRLAVLRNASGASEAPSEWSVRPLPHRGRFALQTGEIPSSMPAPGDLVTLVPLPGDEAPLMSFVPRGALLYDEHGQAWVYRMVDEGGAFARHAMTPDFIVGDEVAFREGPAVNSSVVSTGVAELYGMESGVGH